MPSGLFVTNQPVNFPTDIDLNTSNPDGLESLDFQMSGNESDNAFSQVFRA